MCLEHHDLAKHVRAFAHAVWLAKKGMTQGACKLFHSRIFQDHQGGSRQLTGLTPFHTLPPLLQGVPLNRDWKTKFFNFDIWHIFHLGIAKGWIGSSLVVIIESDIPVLSGQRSVEAKFGQLTDMYKHFCRSNKLAMWVSELSRESLSWPQSSANPLGAWNKGSASTTLMLFLGWFAQAFIKGKTDNEQLLLIASRP